MKKKIFGLLMAVVIGVCSFTSFSSTNALADEAPAINQTVSPEGWYAQNLNASTKLTPEQYLELMYKDPTFNVKAYMFYNEDLMSLYTYDYWKYYKHYLEKGIAQNRVHWFPPEDPYNTVTLGRYSTSYNAKIPRAKNVELAANYMDGTVILPGGTFSYNEAVGKRTTQRGFTKAHIYVGKEVVDGIGGGICQVSSTTYVAMMIAGIPASERHVHSLPVSYLKKNLDATVNWGLLDLKFVNPFSYPIVVNAYAKDGVCTVSINTMSLSDINITPQ